MLDDLAHISTKPWSDYSESDYTLEQWHRACLIHQHDGAPTSKTQCKLPVRTPDGVLNRNGVFAAAAALAGARNDIKATPEEKDKAASALRGFYKQMDAKLPPSLAAHDMMTIDEFLEHYGVRGMHWGIRTKDNVPKVSPSEDSKKLSELKKKPRHALSNQELRFINDRLNMEQQYSRLNPTKVNKGKDLAKKILGISGGITLIGWLNSPAGKAAINLIKSALGKGYKPLHMIK